MTRSNEILCRPQGHSWNSPHSHDGDLSGALYLSCPGEPCVITLLDPRVAAVAGPKELLGSGTIAFNRAQGVGDVRESESTLDCNLDSTFLSTNAR